MKIFKFLLIILFFAMISSCATNQKTIKKPSWIKNTVKVEGNYLIAIGHSDDFGNRSWQMAEMDAHRKMAKAIEFYIAGFRQTYKTFIKNTEGEHAASIRIIDKTHITSKAILSDLEIVKDSNKQELRWYDENTKQYYMKIRLNLSNAGKKINKEIVKELPPKTQEQAIKELTNRSKDAHKRLSEKLKNMKWE